MLVRLASLGAFALMASPAFGAAAVEQAIPRDATDALFVERIGRDLGPTLDAFEQALGAEEAIGFLEDAPLPALAAQMLAGVPREVVGVDPSGGLALYHAPGFNGAVGVVAVSDVDAARSSLEDWFNDLGAEPQRNKTGDVIVMTPDGQEIRSFVRGRFLYLAMPGLQEDALPDHAISGSAAKVIPKVGAPGLDDDAQYGALRSKVRRGNVYLFLRQPFEKELGVGAGILSFDVTRSSVEIDGVLTAPGGGFMRRPEPDEDGGLDPLTSAPPGAVVTASVHLTPEGLGLFLGGPEGSDRRGQFESMLNELKLPPGALLQALDGNAWLRFHIDPKAMARALRDGEEAPIGWFDAAFGISGREPLAQTLSAQHEGQKSAWRLLPKSRTLQRRQQVDGDPIELRLLSKRLELRMGLSGSKAPPQNVLADLQDRFGPDAFGPGHITVFVDVVELRAQLEAPMDLQGLSTPDQQVLRLLMRAPFAQFFGMDHVFLDAFAQGNLIRVRGEVRFVETESRSL